jgi:flagellar protein FlgJ
MTSLSNITTPQATASLLQGRTAASSMTDGMVYNDLRALTDLKTQSREDPQAAMKEVSKQFESLFVNMMMKAMRDALPEDSLFGGSQMRTYQDMFDQQLALDLGKDGSLGLAGLIERQLSQTIAPQTE